MMARPLFSLAAVLVLLAPAAQAEPLSLERFFNGKLSARGTVDNLRDGSQRSFTMAMTGSWKGTVGTLVEDVAFADGERQHKVWTFEKMGEGRYVGRREDLTRDAEIVEDGRGIRMTYKANTRVPSGETYNLAFDDQTVPVSRDAVVVTSEVSYLFVSVARLKMTITRTAAK